MTLPWHSSAFTQGKRKRVPPLESAYKDLLEYLFIFLIQCNAADLWPFRVYEI